MRARWVASAVLGALLVLSATVLVRTVRMPSRQPEVEPIELAAIEPAAVSQRLAEALRLRTVSHADPAQSSPDAFLALHAFLEASYPVTHHVLEREIVAGLSLLYWWRGSDPALHPILLMAHQDVVPVAESDTKRWTQPPFAGSIADGFVWGRGTLDDKGGMIAILEAVEHLARSGFAPRRGILLAFGHDEERGGEGARATARLLQSRGVQLELVLDEGFVLAGGVPGLARPLAPVGIAEKGYLSVELAVSEPGGHSSAPPQETAVDVLARALVRLADARPPARIDGATAAFLEHAAPEMSLPFRIPLANLWLFEPLVIRALATHPAGDATVRTTTAATVLEGSPKDNVLPTRASAVLNHRLLPGDTLESVVADDREAVGDPRVQLEVLPGAVEASALSAVDSPAFALVARTIREVFPTAVVAPNLAIGATDARHYGALTTGVYRFAPFPLHEDDLSRIHGIDERVGVEDLRRAVQFYVQLLRNAAE